jgi:hypothetical protein
MSDQNINLSFPKDPKRKIWLDWIQIAISILTMVISFVALFVTIPNVISNSNEQTQVVIEPRDGDIIVKDGDDYKLLQLINQTDISFPTKVQEIQYKYTESNLSSRVNILNTSNEDWSKKDSFKYVINTFSINPNKVINLLDNIERISVYCDLYAEQNISTRIQLSDENAFKFDMRTSISDNSFEVTKSNITSSKEYVTNEINDGIEWVKIRVEIVYHIGERLISDTITSDWIGTDADMI